MPREYERLPEKDMDKILHTRQKPYYETETEQLYLGDSFVLLSENGTGKRGYDFCGSPLFSQ